MNQTPNSDTQNDASRFLWRVAELVGADQKMSQVRTTNDGTRGHLCARLADTDTHLTVWCRPDLVSWVVTKGPAWDIAAIPPAEDQHATPDEAARRIIEWADRIQHDNRRRP